MSITLKGLRAFTTVLRYGSFTRAASLLNITQPALTVQIRQLEDAVGLKLLDRMPHGAEPTAAGREFARSLEPLLQELEHSVTNLQDLAARRRGVVRVAALPSVAAGQLPAAMARLHATHPQLKIRLREAVTRQVYERVRSDQVDIGIASDLAPGEAFSTEPLFRDQIIALLPPRHPLMRRRSITLAHLAEEPLLLLETDSSIRQLVDDAFARIGKLVSPAQEATYSSTLVGMARAGLGIALLPSTAAELRMAPELAARPLGPPVVGRAVILIWRAGRSLSPAAQAFAEALREEAGQFGGTVMPRSRPVRPA